MEYANSASHPCRRQFIGRRTGPRANQGRRRKRARSATDSTSRTRSARRDKVMTTLFALFAEVERDLISERTREGLAKARSSGKKLGRPKGSLGVSRLDGKGDEIRHLLRLGVSKNAIAKITGVSRPTLYHFIDSRGLQPGPKRAFTRESG